VAVISGLLMPAFLGAAGLGAEASNWSVLQLELQRASDAAAMGAAVVYSSTSDAQNLKKQWGRYDLQVWLPCGQSNHDRYSKLT
jgi:uncharacterized membrane protein